MTKQQIFSLYLANENQKVSNKHGIIKLDYRFMLSSLYNSPDCRLVLKPIAEMSSEHEKELCAELVAYDFKLHEMLNFGGESATFKDNVTLIFWLITHGYALDDTWFTNGIAML